MRKGSPVVIAASFLFAYALVSCAKKTKTITVPGKEISITLDYPGTFDSSTAFCSEAHSVTLSLDTSMDGTGAFVHTLLFDDAFRLQGCGAATCLPEIPFGFPRISRALLEWTTALPETYLTGAPTDVVCRAMAATSGMGSIQLSAPAATVRHWEIAMSVLRVGDFNPLFGSTSGSLTFPAGPNGAASSTRDQFTPRTNDGGKVVLTDALSNAIFWFDPRTLTLNKSSAVLGSVRVGATSTAIGPSSASAVTGDSVLIVGGVPDAGAGTVASMTADLFTIPNTVVQNIPLSSPHAYHAAVSVPQMKGLGNAVVVAGGCDNAANNPNSIVEAILMSPPPSSPSFCTVTAMGPMVCQLEQLLNSACRLAQGRIVGPTPRVAWFGAGLQGGTYLSDSQYLNDDGTMTSSVSFPEQFGRPASAGPGFFGTFVLGGADAAVPARNQVYAVGTSATLAPVVTAMLQEGRQLPQSVFLMDASILVTGGSDALGNPLRSAEKLEFQPAAVSSYLAKPGMTCVSGVETGCVSPLHPRLYHSSTMIDGTTSWLNGSVLIAHGQGDFPPELFVPAYRCGTDGLTPVSADGGPVPNLVDFCDRGMTPRPVEQTRPAP